MPRHEPARPKSAQFLDPVAASCPAERPRPPMATWRIWRCRGGVRWPLRTVAVHARHLPAVGPAVHGVPRRAGHAARYRGHPAGAQRGLRAGPARSPLGVDGQHALPLPAALLRLGRGRGRDRDLVDATDATPEVRGGVPDVLEADDLRRLLEACRGRAFEARRDLAILLRLIDTGMRRGNVDSVCCDHLDLDQSLLRVMGQGGRERLVPVGRTLVQALDRYLRVRLLHEHEGAASLSWVGPGRLRRAACIRSSGTRRARPGSATCIRASCGIPLRTSGWWPAGRRRISCVWPVDAVARWWAAMRPARRRHAPARPTGACRPATGSSRAAPATT